VLVLLLLVLDIAEDEAAELKPVAAALQRLTGGHCVALLLCACFAAAVDLALLKTVLCCM
jgi:hypothetical protein